MAGEPNTEQTQTEDDPFAAAFAGLSGIKDGDDIPADLDFSKPVDKTPAAKVEQAAETTGAAADTSGDTGLDTSDAEERPVAPTHKEDGTPYTDEERTVAQAVLDKEFDDAQAEKAEAAAEAARAKAKTQSDDPVNELARRLNERIGTPAQQETQTQTQQPTAPKPFVFSAEEQSIVAQYEKDFPDVIRGESLLRKREYHNMLSYIFEQFNQRLGPTEQLLAGLAQRTHHDDLTKGIDGYSDELIDKVEAWIEKQPVFLKTAYTAVMESGTAADVKDVITRYRAESGDSAPTPAAAAAAPAAAAAAPAPKVVDPKVAAAARALAPVETKRSRVVVGGVQKDDFDGAFSQFAKEEA